MPCKICIHPERKSLETSLLKGESLRSLAALHSLSHATLARHKRTCMQAVVTAALTYTTVQSGLDTLACAQAVISEATRLQSLAEATGDVRTAILALKEFKSGTELYAKLVGDLPTNQGPYTDPRWLTIRDTILEALRPYPEACRAVLAALTTTPLLNRGEP
jgi:hypothetical protein